MGKKKTAGKPHATMSFEQMVGKANQEALKPYVNQLFANLANDVNTRVFTKLGIFQNRIEVLETLLKDKVGVTQQEIDNVLFDLEDKVTGYRKVDRETQMADLVRLTMRVKPKGKEYGTPTKKEFSRLGLEPYAMGMKFIEEALFGLAVGQTKEVPFDEQLQTVSGVEALEFTIDRISEPIPREAPKTEEKTGEQDVTDQNAQEPSGSPEAQQVTEA